MSTAFHTSGPWKLNNLGYISGPSYTVAKLEPVPGQGWHTGEFVANGRLITAAPEMLEALKECITAPEATAGRSHEMAMRRLEHITAIARFAIEKAEKG